MRIYNSPRGKVLNGVGGQGDRQRGRPQHLLEPLELDYGAMFAERGWGVGEFQMKLSVQSKDDRVTQLRLAGRISQREVDAIGEPLRDALGDDVFSRGVLFDMSEVDAIDSSGVNWLLGCQKKTHESGGHLVLHSLSPIAKNVIRVLNLQTVFKLAVDAAEAQTHLDGDA